MVFIKLIDDFIECDRVFGPMPNFASSFEAYFIEKAYSLLFDHSPNETNDIKYIVSLILIRFSFLFLLH